jgi:hypothetical protein
VNRINTISEAMILETNCEFILQILFYVNEVLVRNIIVIKTHERLSLNFCLLIRGLIVSTEKSHKLAR